MEHLPCGCQLLSSIVLIPYLTLPDMTLRLLRYKERCLQCTFLYFTSFPCPSLPFLTFLDFTIPVLIISVIDIV